MEKQFRIINPIINSLFYKQYSRFAIINYVLSWKNTPLNWTTKTVIYANLPPSQSTDGVHTMTINTKTLPILLNETETAQILNIKPATLRRWRWLGTGPNFRKIGSNVRFHPDDIASYIEQAQRSNTSQVNT